MWTGNDELIAQETAQAAVESEASDIQSRQSREPIPGIVAHVRRCWEAAVQAKREHEKDMLQSLRQRRGEYTAEELTQIAQAGSQPIFMNITDEKCRAAVAWIEDILFQSSDKPWAVSPTTVSDLPEEIKGSVVADVMERAMAAVEAPLKLAEAMGAPVSPEEIQAASKIVKEQARLARDDIADKLKQIARHENEHLEMKLKDVLEEGGWSKAMRQFIENLATFPAAFLKGPVKTIEKSGRIVKGAFVIEEKEVWSFSAPSPLDIFPAPLAVDLCDDFFFERHSLSRRALACLKKLEGYDSEAIDKVLEEYGQGGLRDWTSQSDQTTRDDLEGKDNASLDPEGDIVALQFWGHIQGQMLINNGMDEAMVPDPVEDYAVEVWLIGSYVIKVELNGDPLGRRPYHKACYMNQPGSFWGRSIPAVVAPVQEVANSAARNLLANMGIASGPQVGVDIGRMAEGEDVTEIFPRKIWQFDMTRQGGSGQPLWFFQVPSLANELLAVYQWASNEADNRSGIPKYMYGENQTRGAAGTSSGYAQLVANAAKSIKKVVNNIDIGVIEPSVRLTFERVLQSGEFPEYQGDAKIIARGSSALVAKEQALIRRNETIQMIGQLPPQVQEIIGIPFVIELIRAQVRDLAIDADDELPSGDEVRVMLAQRQKMEAVMMQAQQQPAMQGQPGGPPTPPQPPRPRGTLPGGQPHDQGALMQRRPQ